MSAELLVMINRQIQQKKESSNYCHSGQTSSVLVATYYPSELNTAIHQQKAEQKNGWKRPGLPIVKTRGVK